MRFATVAVAIARKDLMSEWRTRELVPALAQFVVLALVILWPDLALWLPYHLSR